MAETRLIAGKYQLLRKIAQGGMAEVYLAKQTGLVGFEKLVVIKRILPHLVENDEFVRMFLDEARTAADLRHPNVVQIFEIGEDQGTYFIAMEFLHGQDLRRIMKRQADLGGQIPLGHALQMIIDAANGLDYAHKKQDLSGRPLNIIHRDISPQNIIVTYDGTSKIVDFGIAKAASQSTETKSGVLKGKYSYMSPEQASGSHIDQRTDQFALGIVLYEMTTMSRLFKYANEIMTLHAIIECNVKPPTEVIPDFPPALSDIVMKVLAKEKEDRFKDLRGMSDALEEFLADARVVHSPSRLSGYMQDLFKDHIQHEQSLGMPVIDNEASGSMERPTQRSRRRANPVTEGPGPDAPAEIHSAGTQMTQSRAGQRSTTRSQARPAPLPAPPADVDDGDDAPAPGQQTAFTAPGALEDVTPASPPPAAAGRRGVLLGLLAAAVLLGGGGTAAFLSLRGGDAGRLALQTTPDGARVLVDGVPHAEKTPTVLTGLEVGRTYAIRVELPGYVPVLRNVKIQTADPAEASINLERDRSAVLRLRSTPPGARVYLDGRVLDGVTPLEVPDVPADADSHKVVFSKEGFQDETRPVSLKEGGVVDVAVTLAPAQESGDLGKLVISSTPEGATITVNGKTVGTTPLERPIEVAGGKTHDVGAKLTGYEPDVRGLDVGKGQTVTWEFKLEKERPAEVGYLNLDSSPPTQVKTDKGKALGSTPLKRVKLPAGSVVLQLTNDDKGIDHSIKVKIELGKETSQTVTIPKGRMKVVVRGSWAKVYVDSRPVGTTPFPAKEFYAGKHEVRLVNDKLGKDERETVLIKPNEDVKVTREW